MATLELERCQVSKREGNIFRKNNSQLRNREARDVISRKNKIEM